MEKIYENKTNTRKKYTRKNTTIAITLAVALIAIVSLLAISVSRDSYALDEVTTLPDEITTNNPDTSADDIMGATSNVDALPYKDTATDAKLYCLESAVMYKPNNPMIKADTITDKGLIYLASKLEQLQFSTSDFSGITEEQKDDIERWVKQTAYWVYLSQINAEGSEGFSEDVAKVKAETKLRHGNSFTEFPAGNTTTFYDKYGINTIINSALQYHSSANPILNVAVTKANNTWTKKDGGYKSGKISVAFSGAEGFSGLVEAPTTYKLSLNGAPSGTKVYGVNKSTNKETDVTSSLNNLDVNTYSDFYIVVPESSVQKNTNYKMTLVAEGFFKQYSGYYYVSETPSIKAQRVTTIALVSQRQDGNAELALTVTEDTALDISQSIYFIGLIVLLSGLGILYANVKKQKEY